ncbi:MAG: flavodoxin family protein [Pelosinus sp.]|nr:flavodoxin family protein [Pelosinus sp.]
MKVVGINGSARKDGNTAVLIRAVFAELEKHGIETELIELAGKPVRGCMACYKCAQTKDGTCVIKDDKINECIAKMAAADGIILGSPTYFTDVTAEMKALIDRAGVVSRSNGNLLKHKASAAVVALRRGGAIHAFDTMNHFLYMMQTYIVGANYWNMGFARGKGEVDQDEEAMQNMKILGENMALLLQKLHS